MCTWMKRGKKLSAFQLMASVFSRGVQNNLGVQYNKKYSIDEIEEIILIEIGKRPKFYLGFYPEAENKKRLLEIVKEFFITKSFALTTVDLLIGATCNAFDFTLCVYQKKMRKILCNVLNILLAKNLKNSAPATSYCTGIETMYKVLVATTIQSFPRGRIMGENMKIMEYRTLINKSLIRAHIMKQLKRKIISMTLTLKKMDLLTPV